MSDLPKRSVEEPQPERAQRDLDLVGHACLVTACPMTADGRRVVSASHDGSLRVWDLDTGQPVATLQGHADKVLACAALPDGRRVVSASADRTLRVWDLASGQSVATLRGHAARVLACAALPDGRRVVSASADRTLQVWDLASGQSVAMLQGHAAGVTACAVTPDGRHVVSASEDGTLLVWDLDRGRAVATLDGHRLGVTACAVTPDGRHVVSASYDTTLTVWELASGQPVASWQAHAGFVLGCAVIPDGRHVVAASDDRTLQVWDLASRQSVATLHGHASFVTACAVTADGRRVISASCDRTLKVWDLASGQSVATLHGHTSFVTACAVIPDERREISTPGPQPLRGGDRRGDDHPPSSSQRNEHPVPRPPRKHTILFVAANPLGTDRLALEEECAAIEHELSMTSARDDFEFRSKWAVSVDELMRHLNQLQPTILHVSGPRRENELPGGAGILLSNEGGAQYVNERALAMLIASTARPTREAAAGCRVVVLNAWFSAAVAESLRHVVDCVVAMDRAIGDAAARSFAVAFYRALGNRRSVGNAVEQAVAALAAKQLPDNLVGCRTRGGLSADQIFLHTLDSDLHRAD